MGIVLDGNTIFLLLVFIAAPMMVKNVFATEKIVSLGVVKVFVQQFAQILGVRMMKFAS